MDTWGLVLTAVGMSGAVVGTGVAAVWRVSSKVQEITSRQDTQTSEFAAMREDLKEDRAKRDAAFAALQASLEKERDTRQESDARMQDTLTRLSMAAEQITDRQDKHSERMRRIEDARDGS